MQFRLRRKAGSAITGINIAPMVDLVFTLLIFFIVCSTFVEQPSIKLVLPGTRHAETGKIEPLIVTIAKNGKLFLKDEAIEKGPLAEALQRMALEGHETLVLRADKDVAYGIVVDVMDIARGAGIKKITSLTSIKE